MMKNDRKTILELADNLYQPGAQSLLEARVALRDFADTLPMLCSTCGGDGKCQTCGGPGDPACGCGNLNCPGVTSHPTTTGGLPEDCKCIHVHGGQYCCCTDSSCRVDNRVGTC